MRTLTLELHKPEERMPEEGVSLLFKLKGRKQFKYGYYDVDWGDDIYAWETNEIAEWAYMP